MEVPTALQPIPFLREELGGSWVKRDFLPRLVKDERMEEDDNDSELPAKLEVINAISLIEICG
ncbi:hypothetical protein PSTG_04592 [Puccinia striiformis f. sp. tritici PST-78]|uniref:Uncharacterized protein n=1 Tax=Puccinia striiformis f. sp. tritici PST-78 TaxID=1165861 RepID=A0A0L0VS48_9BASI|nr:hypothetical protein PSTG_04592 [Puccinia striiformis f. sp. tritici PST-78]